MRKVLFLGVFFVIGFSSSAQTWQITDKIYVGGGLGFNLGTDVLSYSLSPYAGYKVTDALSAGLRVTYQYTKFNQSDITINAYGLGPFARYKFAGPLFAHAEYEFLTFKVDIPGSGAEANSQSFNSLLVGGGLSQPLGRAAAFNVLFLYNLLYEDGTNSPYNSPVVIRAGIAVGF